VGEGVRWVLEGWIGLARTFLALDFAHVSQRSPVGLIAAEPAILRLRVACTAS
jgi:hypothetical protein